MAKPPRSREVPEFEVLFQAADHEYKSHPKTREEKVMENVEQEFTGFSEERRSRQKEKTQIYDQIRVLRKKLRRFRNLRNSRQRHVNEQRAKKRAEFRQEMERLKVRLQEIEDEESPPQ